MPFAQKRMGFQDPPRLFIRKDQKNAQNPLGKTAFYDPEAKSVTLYVVGRHPKDVMRSLSHELVHHTQNCNGEFENIGQLGDGYAQNDEHLREMERQAYEMGNLCFRDWEDSIKQTIYFEHLQKGVENVMSLKEWKNREIHSLLTEKWGFSFNLDKLNEDCACDEQIKEGEEEEGEDIEEPEEEDTEEVNEMCADMGDVEVVGDEMAVDAGEEVVGDPAAEALELVTRLQDILSQLAGVPVEDAASIDEPVGDELTEVRIRRLVRTIVSKLAKKS